MSANNGTAATEPSRYLRYLPSIYWDDVFLGRFLRIFEDVFTPVQGIVGALPSQFDPALSSAAMLQVLESWVGAESPRGINDARKRRFIKESMHIHRTRGTRQSLRLALELLTGHRPYINEYSPGMVIGADTSLGLNSALLEGGPLQFHVTFDCNENEIDQGLVHAIIQRFKPAHVDFTISYRPEAQVAG